MLEEVLSLEMDMTGPKRTLAVTWTPDRERSEALPDRLPGRNVVLWLSTQTGSCWPDPPLREDMPPVGGLEGEGRKWERRSG